MEHPHFVKNFVTPDLNACLAKAGRSCFVDEEVTACAVSSPWQELKALWPLGAFATQDLAARNNWAPGAFATQGLVARDNTVLLLQLWHL